MSDDWIVRVRARLAQRGEEPAPSISLDELEIVERRLGLTLPPSVRRAYLEIGNGGYGPESQFYPLSAEAGAADAVACYRGMSTPDPKDPHWAWPAKLLPVLGLGCGMMLCVDCSTDEARCVWFEPNPHVQGASWDDAFFRLDCTFESFVSAWADGEDAMQIIGRTLVATEM